MTRRELKSYAPVLIKVAVRRLTEDEGDETPANQLRWAADIVAAAEDYLGELTQRAAAAGMTWREIGLAMNVSGQAAHRRFAQRVSTNDWDAEDRRKAEAILDSLDEQPRG